MYFLRKHSIRHGLLLSVSVSCLSLQAHAQVLTINTSQTVSVDITGADSVAPATGQQAVNVATNNLIVNYESNLTGGSGGAGANGGVNPGGNGAHALNQSANGGTHTMLAGTTIRGGNGGNGGNGTASAGGNGGAAGNAVNVNSGTFIFNGALIGGTGGNGGNGDNGIGGNGGVGGRGADIAGASVQYNSTVTGGNGGNGGNAVGGNNSGGNGATGSGAVRVSTGTHTFRGNVTAGNGGNGGTSSGTAANSSGGAGGTAFTADSSVGTIRISSGVTVTGGNGGTAGTGGSGAAGSVGQAGSAFLFNIGSATGTIIVEQGALVQSGLSGGTGNATIRNANAYSLTNAGTVQGGQASAQTINLGSTLSTLDNSGTLGRSDSTASTIDLTIRTINNFINSGLITAGSGHTINLSSGGAQILNFTNSGTISSGTGAALNLVAGTFLDSTLDNTGGTITSGNASATSGTINFNSNMGGRSITGGTISNTAGGNAFYTAASQGAALTLENVAVIGHITGGANTQNFTLTGSTSMTGDMDLGAGANIVTLNGIFTGAEATDFAATTGTMAMTIGSLGRVTLNGIQEAANNITTLSVDADGVLSLNANFDGSNLLTNNGRINLGPASTLRMANMAAGGVGNIWDFAIKDSTNYGSLIVGGINPVDFTNSQIRINTALMTTPLSGGTELKIADGGAAAALGTLNNTLAPDDSLLLNFLILRGDDATLTAAGRDNTQVFVKTQRTALEQFTQTENQSAAAALLDAIEYSGGAGLDQLRQILDTASNAGTIATILDQVTPEPDQSIRQTNMAMVDNIEKLLDNRLSSLRGMGASSDELPSRVWIQGFGSMSEQGTESGFAGFKARTAGMAVGADTDSIIENATFGAVLSYGGAKLQSKDSTNKKTNIDTYMVSLYGDYKATNRTSLSGLISYGYGKNDTKRDLLNTKIYGDFASHVVNGQLKADYAWGALPCGISITPHVLTDYTFFSQDGHDERGIGALSFQTQSAHTLAFGTGLKISGDYRSVGDMRFMPHVGIGFTYDVFSSGNTKAEAGFADAPSAGTFVIQGQKQNPAAFNLGGGFDLYTKDNLQFTADYNFEKRADYNSHAALVRLSYRF